MINLIISPIFLLLLAFFSLAGELSIFFFYLYSCMSLITFGFFAFDKHASIQSKSRISEKTLFLLITFSGWPGALLAQTLLRHKSAKLSFIKLSWCLILLNLFLLSLFLWRA